MDLSIDSGAGKFHSPWALDEKQFVISTNRRQNRNEVLMFVCSLFFINYSH
jgi:hypothetical protein